ncbi:hypothetical protein SBOR_8875 [Sclerotinia borealis F-4128]|uniref:Nephrocystin 3-like N-terminal domain-containing protein n=1 Tax=Sclerotinia borealis (strain F-4128) TaxID=1432307 RepID=W9C4D2_SCLBF|nr:hypothetical protein SBOR_8875 [Sclerotinia borealis F-4128]
MEGYPISNSHGSTFTNCNVSDNSQAFLGHSTIQTVNNYNAGYRGPEKDLKIQFREALQSIASNPRFFNIEDAKRDTFEEKGTSVIKYFLSELGHEHEKKLTGLLSSVFDQLLDLFPGLISSFILPIFKDVKRHNPRNEFLFPEQELKDALKLVVEKCQTKKTVILLIDGWDECEPEMQSEGLYFLKDWVDSTIQRKTPLSIKLCLASRLNEIMTERMNAGRKDLRDTVRDALSHKIARKGSTEQDLHQNIDELPEQIEELYKRFVTQLECPKRAWKYLQLFCLPCEAGGFHPWRYPTLLELSFVDTTVARIIQLDTQDKKTVFALDIIDRLQESCGQFLEVIDMDKKYISNTLIESWNYDDYPSHDDDMRSVQPVHKTVVEFIAKKSRFAASFEEASESDWLDARITQLRCWLRLLVVLANPEWGDQDSENLQTCNTPIMNYRLTAFFSAADYYYQITGADRFCKFEPCCNIYDNTSFPQLDKLTLAMTNGLFGYVKVKLPLSDDLRRATARQMPLLLCAVSCLNHSNLKDYQRGLDLVKVLLLSGSYSVNELYRGLSSWQYLILRTIVIWNVEEHRPDLDIYSLFLEHRANPDINFGPGLRLDESLVKAHLPADPNEMIECGFVGPLCLAPETYDSEYYQSWSFDTN